MTESSPTQSSVPSNESATLAAAQAFFRFFVGLGAASVVFGALSYLCGASVLRSEFGVIGASWYSKTLPFDRTVHAGLVVVVPMAVVLVFVFYAMASEVWLTANVLSKVALFGLFGSSLFALMAKHVSLDALDLSFVAAGAFSVSAASAIGSVVAAFRDSVSLSKNSAYLILPTLATIALVGLVPQLLGKSQGRTRGAEMTSSPTVELPGQPPTSWRLVDANGDTALLVNTPESGRQREFRLLKLDATVRVFAEGASAPSRPSEGIKPQGPSQPGSAPK